MDPLRAISDWVFGFDFFISYSRQDGSAYAHALAFELARIGYRVFLDTAEMPPGEELTFSLRGALVRSSVLVSIVSPGALTSRYMPGEFDHYLEGRKRKRKIVPISLGRTLDDAEPNVPLIAQIRSKADVIWITEHSENLTTGPSPETFKTLIDGFRFTRRNTIRHRVISSVSVLLLVLAGLAASAAWVATERARLALSRQLVAQSRNRLSSAPDLALLLAAEAHHLAPTAEAKAGLAEALGALAQLTGQEHAPGGAIEHAGYSADDHYFGALAPAGLLLWDTAAWSHLATLRHEGASYTSFAFHPDGTRLAVCGGDAGVEIWTLAHLEQPEAIIPLRGAMRVAFAPDRRQLLVGTGDGHIWLIDPSTKETRDLGQAHRGFVTAIVPDFAHGKFYTAGMSAEHNVAGWDFSRLRVERYFDGHEMSVNALALSADGARLASAGEERVVIVWETESGKAQLQLASQANPVWKYGLPEPRGTGALDLAFVPGRNELLAAYDDGRVLVWDLASGKGGEIRAHLGAAFALAPQPNSTRFASGGSDGKVRFWDLAQVHPSARLLVSGSQSRFLGLTKCGAVLCAAEENRVRCWNITTGAEEAGGTWSSKAEERIVAFSAASNCLAASVEGTSPGVVIHHGAHYEQTLHLGEARGEPGRAALDPKAGRWFASPSAQSALSTWALRESPPLAVSCQDASRELTALGASSDGSWLIGGSRENIMLWNPANGRVIARLSPPAGAEAPTVVSGHAESKIVAAGYLQFGTIAFWELRDPANPRLLGVTHEHAARSAVEAFAFNADGTRMLSLGSEGEAVLWELPAMAALARFDNFGDGYLRSLPINEAGTLAASSGAEGLLLFDLSPRDWDLRARSLAGRSLSEEERRVFLQPAR